MFKRFQKRKDKKEEGNSGRRSVGYYKPICPQCGHKERVGMINGKWFCFEHRKEL